MQLIADVTSCVTAGINDRSVDLQVFQTYGLPGLLIGGALLLVYRLIDAVSRSAYRRGTVHANAPEVKRGGSTTLGRMKRLVLPVLTLLLVVSCGGDDDSGPSLAPTTSAP